MTINRKFLQLGLEALIPLLGFFLWNWSLYFILLFYFLDMFASEVMMHLKSKKIYEHHGDSAKEWFLRSAISTVVFIFGLLVIHAAVLFIADGINFKEEVIAFWTYEELGLQQGYVFVPLVFFVSYQQYKMEYLMPARYRNIRLQQLWFGHIRSHIVVLGFAGLVLMLSIFVILPEIVYVLGIVLFTILYKLKFD